VSDIPRKSRGVRGNLDASRAGALRSLPAMAGKIGGGEPLGDSEALAVSLERLVELALLHQYVTLIGALITRSSAYADDDNPEADAAP